MRRDKEEERMNNFGHEQEKKGIFAGLSCYP